MTRQDYVRLAAAIRPLFDANIRLAESNVSYSTEHEAGYRMALLDVTAELGRAFYADNPSFDFAKWHAASRPEGYATSRPDGW